MHTPQVFPLLKICRDLCVASPRSAARLVGIVEIRSSIAIIAGRHYHGRTFYVAGAAMEKCCCDTCETQRGRLTELRTRAFAACERECRAVMESIRARAVRAGVVGVEETVARIEREYAALMTPVPDDPSLWEPWPEEEQDARS